MEFKHKGISVPGKLFTPKQLPAPGILLLHSWWGLNSFILETGTLLSEEGFLVLALDYFTGKTAETIEEAKSLRQETDRKTVNKLVAGSIDYLTEQNDLSSPHISVIGFSLGAGFAIEASRSRTQNVRKVVVFYGTGGGKFEKVQANFQGHFAENDLWGVHTEKVEAFRNRLEIASRTAQFFTYPNTQHWFMETNRPEYSPESARLAWKRTLAFLK